MIPSLTLNEKYNSHPAIRLTAQLIQAVLAALQRSLLSNGLIEPLEDERTW